MRSEGVALTNTKRFGVGIAHAHVIALSTPRPMLTAMCWGLGKSVFARAPSRINRVRYWRPLSGFLFLRRVSPDRGGGIIAALPSVNNLIAVETTYPMSNPLAQLRAEINDLAALLTSARFYFVRHI